MSHSKTVARSWALNIGSACRPAPEQPALDRGPWQEFRRGAF